MSAIVSKLLNYLHVTTPAEQRVAGKEFAAEIGVKSDENCVNLGTPIAILTTRTYIYVQTLPLPSQILKVNFSGEKGNMTGTVTLNSVTDTTTTSRPVLITWNGGSPSVTVDITAPGGNLTGPFTPPPTETGGVATPQGDVNPVGTGPAGSPFPFTVPAAPTVPAASTVISVSFTP